MLATIASLLFVCGCGFTSGSQLQAPQNTTVVIAPQSTTVLLGQSIQFSATVTGGNSSAVNWSVNNVAEGNSSIGTISTAGLYTAPANMPASPTVTVTVTTQTTPAASASATVQIQSGISVSISPASANAMPGASVNFAATVNGGNSASSGVSWTVNGVSGGNATLGFLSATGLNFATYTAPAIPPSGAVSVIATSDADPSKSAAASVSISCAAPNSISPAAANIAQGATQNFTASLCVAAGAPLVWDVNGVVGGNAVIGVVVANGPSAATYTAPANVPATNPVTIDASVGSQKASATVTVASAAAISVSVAPSSASIAAGQRASFTASVSGTTNSSVTWTVDGITNGNGSVGQVCAPASNPCVAPSGAETSVDYVAPQTPPQPNAVVLTATSVADTTKSGSAQVAITGQVQASINVAPFYAFLAPSQPFHFFATATGAANTSLIWAIASTVPGQGCSGATCGTIDNAGNYVTPATAPSPNAVQVSATSVANPSLTATATVAVNSGPTVETVLPSSVTAGAQQSFTLAVQGLNFVATTATGTSEILVNNSPRSTNCPTSNRCTITLQPADVSASGALSLQVQNPGAPGTLSNPISLIVLPAPVPPNAISLTSAAPVATGNDIVVPEATTAGVTTSPVSVDFAGMVSPDGSTCTIQASPIAVTRPASGTMSVNICVQGNFLDSAFTYSFSAPQTGGDIGISTTAMSSLFPNLVELTVAISSQTAAGVRTLFVTTPNGDVAAATGVLEVK